MNGKAEVFMSDGRSFVIHAPADELAAQLANCQKEGHQFYSTGTVEGSTVYLNPVYVISITDYSYPEERSSYYDREDRKEDSKKQTEEQKAKAEHNKQAAEQFKKEIDNME